MFYYALVDENNVCTAVYAMPAAISGSSYIEITEEQYNDSTLIGKKYVDGEWVTVTSYYYAILNEKNIVINVYQSDTEMSAADNLVAITQAQYNDSTLIGKWYNRESGVFTEPPISVLAEHSTSEIQYKEEEKWLDTKLDEMDTAINNRYTKEESDAKYALAGSGGATMTSAEILAAIKEVDGAGSGLDADTLDGKSSTDFASSDHTHTGYAAENHTHTEYAATEHTHTGYAAADHTHEQSDITGLTTALSGKANTDHTHSGYAASEHTHSQNDITGLATALAGKSDTDHTHSGYAASNHTHNEYAASNHTHNGYAASEHTHSQSDITGLSNALSGKSDVGHTHSGYAASNHSHSEYAASNHTHSGYASSSHTHSNYFEKTGGTISGETNFSGGLVRVKGVQSLYHSGSQMILASDSIPTKICGSAITSSKAITTASDERLKEDVTVLNKQEFIDFVKNVELVSYRYKGEPNGTKHIGVIAQQLLEINPDIAKYFVYTNEDGYYSVDYAALSLLAVLSLQ